MGGSCSSNKGNSSHKGYTGFENPSYSDVYDYQRHYHGDSNNNAGSGGNVARYVEVWDISPNGPPRVSFCRVHSQPYYIAPPLPTASAFSDARERKKREEAEEEERRKEKAKSSGGSKDRKV